MNSDRRPELSVSPARGYQLGFSDRRCSAQTMIVGITVVDVYQLDAEGAGTHVGEWRGDEISPDDPLEGIAVVGRSARRLDS